jgi:hypothetical protein
MRNTSRLCSGALLLACAIFLLAPPAVGSTATTTTLHSPSDSARWSAELSNAAIPDPGACALSSCASRSVSVALPRHAWPRHGGGLLVALHWDLAHFDQGYDLDLYVYAPDGRLAAKSSNFAFSSDEAAWIQDPVNGLYRIVVVPRTVIGSLHYDVAVSFQRGYTVHEGATFRLQAPGFPDSSDLVILGRKPTATHRLLPDLVPGKPSNFHMESTIGGHYYLTGARGLNHQPSCYLQETTGVDNDDLTGGPTGALRCLRWDKVLENHGHGPYELRSYQSDADGSVHQTVYDSDGGYTERRVPQASYVAYHGRVRFSGFDDTALYSIDSHGRPGRIVARMDNNGSCKGDTQNANFARSSDGPLHYATPGTCDTYDWSDSRSQVHPDDTYVRLGISSGWLDTAPWYLPDQYINVTNVPDGRYLMIETINAAGNVFEAPSRNNTSVACVELKGISATECRLPPAPPHH